MPQLFEEQLRQITPHVFAVVRGNKKAGELNGSLSVNCGLVVSQTTSVVIDTLGFPSHGRALREAVLAVAAVPDYLLNTHFHLDHTFGNRSFAEATCIMHAAAYEGLEHHRQDLFHPEAVEEAIRQDPENKWLREVVITDPDLTFTQELTLRLDSVTLQIRHLGGHSADLSVVYVVEDDVLFASDLLVTGKYPYMGRQRGLYWGMSNVMAWIAGLKTVEAWAPSTIIPGHGEISTVREITAMRVYLEGLVEAVHDLAQQGMPPGEIAEHVSLPHLMPNHMNERADNALAVYYQLCSHPTE